MRNFCNTRRGITVLGALFLVLSAGCKGKGGSTLPAGSLANRMTCKPTDKMTATDVNNDGVHDITHVSRQGKPHCTTIDLNFDGNIDVSRFYASDGRTIVHEQHDFDFDGKVDQLSFFEDGQLARKELDTNFDNSIDTWMWCAGGWVTRAERDRGHSGKADSWETYSEGLLVEAGYDENNDGKPEKWELFRKGRHVATRIDTNRDGKPDQTEEVALDDIGAPDEVLRCESTPDPKKMTASPKGESLEESKPSETAREAANNPSETAGQAVDTDSDETHPDRSTEPSNGEDGDPTE